MLQVECLKTIKVHYGQVFTRGKLYLYEKFNTTNGIDTYHAKNDFGEYHLLGRIDDVWFSEHFKVIDKTIEEDEDVSFVTSLCSEKGKT